MLQRRTRLKGTGDEGAWATVGVLVRKSAPRESASGNMYSVWSLSNLDGARPSRQAACLPRPSQLPCGVTSRAGLEPPTRRAARARPRSVAAVLQHRVRIRTSRVALGREQQWRRCGDDRCAGTTESCFLFGEAHQDHYRESQGAVVALFNARVSAPWALSRLCCRNA